MFDQRPETTTDLELSAKISAPLRDWVPIAVIEMEFSLAQRTTERELLPMAGSLGLGVSSDASR
jgi:aryl-alcohol dehydrogenase-like predicted oxidoreductase